MPDDVADVAARAVEALIRATDALADALDRADPVILATALDARREAVEWLQENRHVLTPEAGQAMASIAARDSALAARAEESLSEVRMELALLRRSHGSLRALSPGEPPPRFVSRRA